MTKKIWTREDVKRHLDNFDFEAAKKWKYTFNYYLDENDDYGPAERAIFVAFEWIPDDHPNNIKSSIVRGTKRMKWLWDASNALKRREEYGDVGDHCLISRKEAGEYLAKMGLRIEEAEEYLVRAFTERAGYPPVMLPEDPRWRARRDAA